MARTAGQTRLRSELIGDVAAGGAHMLDRRCTEGAARAYAPAPRPMLVMLCTHACAADARGHAGWAWRRAVELARCGHDVWVVTASDQRMGIEYARARLELANLRVVYWDLPQALARLNRWRWGRRLCRALWYRHVQRAVADWHASIGMQVLRRVVYRSRSSITYFTLPSAFRSSAANPPC